MKKIFFVVIAATLLAAGCQKTEVLNQVVPDGEPSMSYAPSMGKLTKAANKPSEAGRETLQNQNFHLWAYYATADENRGAKVDDLYDGMSNILVTYTKGTDGATGDWSTDPIHFWPGKDKALKFFAVSADETISTTLFNDNNIVPNVIGEDKKEYDKEKYNGLKISKFTVNPANPSSDLMVADYLTQTQTENLKVALNFRHALTKVEFWFKNEKGAAEDGKTSDPKTQVWVQHVEVKNVATEGSLDVAPTSTSADRFTWTPVSTSTEKFVAQYGGTPATDINLRPEGGTASDASNYEFNPKNYMKLTAAPTPYDTWLVIPQTNADLKVEIVYVISDRQYVISFPLFDDKLTSWEPNQYIKYNINLTPNIIGFNPTVEEWDPSDKGKEEDLN